MTDPLNHPLNRESKKLFDSCWLSPDAKALLSEELTAGTYLSRLSAQELHEDAIQCLAYAMPNRQAVWWLCHVLWHLRCAYTTAAEEAAIRAAVQWVIEPTPANVSAAEKASDETRFDSAARCAANAAFLAGSGPQVDDPPIPTTRQRLAAQLVGGGISLALLARQAAGVDLTAKQALLLGYDVVRGISRWDTILAAHALSESSK